MISILNYIINGANQMEVHPRIEIRALAEVEHSKALLKVIQKYDLTYGEIFTMLSSSMTQWAKYLKSDEDKERRKRKE